VKSVDLTPRFLPSADLFRKPRPMPIHVRLAPLTRTISHDASWRGQDDFPANQIWADEVERILSFLESQCQFDRFLPKLRGKVTQRDGALAEARVAFFFFRNGFNILSWEPKGAGTYLGDIAIQWRELPGVFVEVKGPRWEGELDESELRGHRRSQPRYLNAEARWADPVGKLMEAVEKALPKFPDSRPNLLVVVDDMLFVSILEWPKNIIVPSVAERLAAGKFSIIGGILVFNTVCYGQEIVYRTLFIENGECHPKCRLPRPMVKGLTNLKLDERVHTVP